MKTGDHFKTSIQEGDGYREIEYEVCSLVDLLTFLDKGGKIEPFDDVLRRAVGFARGDDARAVTITEIRNNSDLLSPRLREDLSTPEGRAKIASRFST